MHPLVKKAKELCPNPTAWSWDAPDMCVGGAYCRVINRHYAASFPDPIDFARHLIMGNHRLDDGLPYWLFGESRAVAYAMRIIASNERGDFEEAYAILDEALSYGQALDICCTVDDKVLTAMTA